MFREQIEMDASRSGLGQVGVSESISNCKCICKKKILCVYQILSMVSWLEC